MASNPLAAAIVGTPAPTAPKLVQRSKYLAEVLRANTAAGAHTPAEAGLKLLAQAILQHKANVADDRATAAEAADRQAQQAFIQQQIAAIFPDDPRAQAAAMLNPEALTGAVAKQYEPMAVNQGQTVLQGGKATYTAPKTEIDGGYVISYSPEAMNVLGQRPESYGEKETNRHNVVGEQQGWRGLDISQQNANTGAFTAQTGRMAFDARKAAGGFGTPGVGSIYGAQLPGSMDDWQIQLPGGK